MPYTPMSHCQAGAGRSARRSAAHLLRGAGGHPKDPLTFRPTPAHKFILVESFQNVHLGSYWREEGSGGEQEGNRSSVAVAMGTPSPISNRQQSLYLDIHFLYTLLFKTSSSLVLPPIHK